jgi:hypothetical protein
VASKLTFHVQKPTDWPDWLAPHIRASGVGWAKLMDPDMIGGDPLPGVRTIGRLYFDQDRDLQLIQYGADGARQYVSWCEARWRAAPWVYVWEGPNEPAVPDVASAARLGEFEAERVRLMHQRGLRAAVLCLGTSHPAGPASNPLPEIRAKWDALAPALQQADYLALHEYGMATLDHTALNEWHVGHYRRGVDWLRGKGRRVPPILITEHGVDWAGGKDTDGWRARLGGNEGEYLRQLALRDAEYSADPDVEAVTVFTWATYDWHSFEVGESMSWRIVEHIKAAGTHQSVPQPVPGTLNLDEARLHKLVLNRAAGLYQAIVAAGQMPASHEYYTGPAPRQWGYHASRGRWYLWEWGPGARVIHEEAAK